MPSSLEFCGNRYIVANSNYHGIIPSLALQGRTTMSQNLPLGNSTSDPRNPEASTFVNLDVPSVTLDHLTQVLENNNENRDSIGSSKESVENRPFFDRESKLLRQRLIERILSVLIEIPHYQELELDLLYDNAKDRLAYLSSTEFVSISNTRNSTQLSGSLLAEWEKNKMIFSVNCFEKLLYPAFQFKSHRPVPLISRILKELPEYMNSWQIAFWFESGNGWLGGARPKDSLNRVDQIMVAARQKALAHCR